MDRILRSREDQVRLRGRLITLPLLSGSRMKKNESGETGLNILRLERIVTFREIEVEIEELKMEG